MERWWDGVVKRTCTLQKPGGQSSVADGQPHELKGEPSQPLLIDVVVVVVLVVVISQCLKFKQLFDDWHLNKTRLNYFESFLSK